MPRFLALDRNRKSLGPPFEAPDQSCAYAQGRLLYPGQCCSAQSVLDREEELLDQQSTKRRTRKRDPDVWLRK